jgi:hypothetical protein
MQKYIGITVIALFTWAACRSTAYASTNDVDLVRIGVFSLAPTATKNEILSRLQAMDAKRAGQAELGQTTPQGFYFHALIPRNRLAELTRGLPARIVVSTEMDSQAKSVPEGKRRIILTVEGELPASRRPDLRFFQIAPNAAGAMGKLIQTLDRLKIPHGKEKPFRLGEKGLEIFAKVPVNALAPVLSAAVEAGPLEIRNETGAELTASELNIRFLIDEQAVQLDTRQGKGHVYVAHLATPVLTISPEEFKKTLIANGAVKAGDAELGELVAGKPYFHFKIAEEKFSLVIGLLAPKGTLRLERRKHTRQMAPGTVRAIVDFFTLEPGPSPTPPAKALPVAVVPPPPPPISPPPVELSKPLAWTSNAPAAFNDLMPIRVHERSPARTYKHQLTIQGVAPKNVKLVSESGAEIPVAENGVFNWTIENKKGEINHHSLSSFATSEKAISTYDIYRHPFTNFTLGAGALPSRTGGFTYIGAAHLKIWADQVFGDHWDPREFQRFGLGFYALSIFNGQEGNKLEPFEVLDIKYRLTPGLQETDDTAIVSLSHERLHFLGKTGQFFGVGLAYDSHLPRFVDMLINWIPFFDFPKRIELGASYHPFILGSGNTVSSNWLLYLEGKMFFTPRLYLFARPQLIDVHYVADQAAVDLKAFFGQAGLGYLF